MSRALSWKPLREVGRRSYGIYLFHLPIVVALESLRTPHSIGNAVVVSTLRVFLTLAAAWLSFRFIETPFLKTSPAVHRHPEAGSEILS